MGQFDNIKFKKVIESLLYQMNRKQNKSSRCLNYMLNRYVIMYKNQLFFLLKCNSKVVNAYLDYNKISDLYFKYCKLKSRQ